MMNRIFHIAFLVASTSKVVDAIHPTDDGGCDFGDDYTSTLLFSADYESFDLCPAPLNVAYNSCRPLICPDIDGNIVVGLVSSFQRSDDFPGNLFPGVSQSNSSGVPQITSSYAIWVESKKNETLQCFGSKGLTFSVENLGDNRTREILRGHILKFFYDAAIFGYARIFSGPNNINLHFPGMYYIDGGEYEIVSDDENKVEDFRRITGNWVDVCAELEAALNGGEDKCEDIEDRKECKKRDECTLEKGECVSAGLGVVYGANDAIEEAAPVDEQPNSGYYNLAITMWGTIIFMAGLLL